MRLQALLVVSLIVAGWWLLWKRPADQAAQWHPVAATVVRSGAADCLSGGRGTLHGARRIPFIEYEYVVGGERLTSNWIRPGHEGDACVSSTDASGVDARVGDTLQAYVRERDHRAVLKRGPDPSPAWLWLVIVPLFAMVLGLVLQLGIGMLKALGIRVG